MIKDKGRFFFVVFIITICFNIALSKNLKCKFCKNKINGRYITQEKNAYHEQCYQDHIQLKCDHCKNIINGIESQPNQKPTTAKSFASPNPIPSFFRTCL